MLVSKLLRIDDTTIQEIEELVRKLSEKEYTSFSALVRTLIRKGIDTMTKSNANKARENAIKYFAAATHGQPNDIERWVDFIIEASQKKECASRSDERKDSYQATGWEDSGLRISTSSIGLANAQSSKAGAFVLPLFQITHDPAGNAGVIVFNSKEEVLILAKILLELGTK